MNESELLFTQILGCQRIDLYLENNLILDRRKTQQIAGVLKKRLLGQPIQYILGQVEFMGLNLKVTQDTLIPRPETEILVETVIKFTKNYKQGRLNILDLATGSGCIAVSLAKNLAAAQITATDISQLALEVAKENARLHKVIERIYFIESDLFDNYLFKDLDYDIIVSNPPYIAAEAIEKLQPEIKYEPRISLDGGSDGLDFYRRIIKDAPVYLKKNGLLIMEIGFDQREEIENIFQKSGKFEIIEVIRDYNSINRVIVAQINKVKYG